jgi:hypothetical protein
MAQFSEGERFPMPRVAANISPMRAWSVVVLRWLLMIGVPVALAVVTLPRPTIGAYQDVYHGVGPEAGGYLLGYLLQLPLSGLLFVAALMLTRRLTGFWAWLSRIALLAWVLAWTADDAVIGLSVGAILRHLTPDMNVHTVAAIVQHLYDDPLVGGVGSVIGWASSYAWGLAMLFTVVALFLANRKRAWWQLLVPSLLLLASFVQSTDFPPYATIAMACFAAASLWFELFRFGPAAPTSWAFGGDQSMRSATDAREGVEELHLAK